MQETRSTVYNPHLRRNLCDIKTGKRALPCPGFSSILVRLSPRLFGSPRAKPKLTRKNKKTRKKWPVPESCRRESYFRGSTIGFPDPAFPLIFTCQSRRDLPPFFAWKSRSHPRFNKPELSPVTGDVYKMPLPLGIVPMLAGVKGFKIHFFSGSKMSCCHDMLIPWQITNVYTGGGGKVFCV